MTKINLPFKKLKKIHHFADIHIRNLKRHTEYRQVFDKVYTQLKQDSEDSIIYIGGDIVHAKLDMSPELIDLTSDFFKNLADIAPTIIITGNHDCNLNNLSRLDALQPIINNLNHPNLHYLRDTGVYELADTKVAVLSVFDENNIKKYPKASDIDGDTKIAFFHGSINNSSTDFGFNLKNPEHTIKLFDGYDLALLGDIHKRQFLNNEKTIAYCGSLIQQNHGELLEHGFLTWDVPSRTAKFKEVKNDYGYYTLDVDNGVVPKIKDMPSKARLRVRISNTDSSEQSRVVAEIHRLYNIKDMSITKVDTLSKQKSGDRNNKVNVGDVRNPDYQYTLIQDYLERNYPISNSILKEIRKLNSDINQQLPGEDIQRNISWKLKTFEFDNMFSYGENNKVNFSNLNGIIGLFAPNASGKSSLLDALTYCLFDTSSRTWRALDVLNNKKDYFTCKLNFEINGKDYWVERIGAKKKNGHVKVNVDFWTFDESGEKISLNGDQRRTTNNSITKVIGTYDDFILTALSLQTNGTVFIDKTQKERKEILAQFMDLNIFDKLYTIANEQIHEVSSVLRNFKNEDYGSELANTQELLSESQKNYDTFYEIKEDISKEQKDLNSKILLLSKEIKHVDDSIIDIDKLETSELNYTEKIEELDNTLRETDRQITSTNGELSKLEDSYLEYEHFDEEWNSYNDLYEELDHIKKEISSLNTTIKHNSDKVDRLNTHEYDPNCEYCVKNPFVKDASNAKKLLEIDNLTLKQMKSELDSINKKISDYGNITERYEEYKRLIQDLNRLKNTKDNLGKEKLTLTANRSNYQTQLETIEDKIIQYYENEELIKKNNEIKSKMKIHEDELQMVDSRLTQANDKVNILFGKIKVYESKIDDINSKIDKVKELETKYEAYEYYLDAIKRDGVPYELISQTIPLIETEVNNILAQIVDFTAKLEVDGKNINTIIHYDDNNQWPLELSSGMERFISALALRVALINVSNLPRPHFLAIDEGFGVLDSDNLNSLYLLFDYLKTQFKFLMVISHIDAMRDLMDTLIEIKKEKGYSLVNYSS